MLSQKQILENAENIKKLIDKYVKSDRKEKIFKMLEKIGNQYFTAPASSKTSYHSAFDGGLAYHSMSVTKRLFEIAETFGKDIDKEELLTVGLFHDVGKCTTVSGQDYYIKNESEWHRKNLGQMYKINQDVNDGLTIAQRSIRLLTLYGINLSDDAYQSVLFHDGLFVDENKTVRFKESKMLLLIQFADYWTTHIDSI